MLHLENRELIREFRDFLEETGYDTINQKLRKGGYFYDPLPDYEQTKYALGTLEKRYILLFSLLLLGDAVKKEEFVTGFGERIASVMLELGIIVEKKGYLRTDGYLLVSYLDRYLLVGIPYVNPNCVIKDPAVYIGIDSFRLTDNISSRRVDTVLDLCTGSGVQVIFGSIYANKAYGVELNPAAVPVTKFNVMLNEMEDRIEILNGSLYDPVGDMTFDRIYSNPPFIAVPDTIDYSMAGAGGTDGLDIVRQIFEGYKTHLNDNGLGIMIGEAIGTEKEPFLVELLRSMFGPGYETQVVLDMKVTIEAQLDRIVKLTKAMGKEPNSSSEELYNKYITLYEDMKATDMYSFYVRTRKSADGDGRVEVIDFTHKWNRFSIPKRTALQYQIIKLNQFYGLAAEGKIAVSVNDTMLDFVNSIDGKHSIEELFDIVASKNKEKFAYRSRIEFIEDVAQVCGLLEERNIIEK